MPAGERFVDVFGGGGCVTLHATTRGKWSTVVYNELSSHMYRLFDELVIKKTAVDLEKLVFTDKAKFKEVLNKPKDEMTLEDEIILVFFSFGYNMRTYMFGDKTFKWKMNNARALFYGDTGTWLDDVYKEASKYSFITDKYRVYRAFFREHHRQVEELQQVESLQQIERIEQVERMQQVEKLEQVERMQQVEHHNLDYRQLEIKTNDIIYCDPPYVGKQDYVDVPTFDEETFINWYQNCPAKEIYISEYTVLPGTEVVSDLGGNRPTQELIATQSY